MTAAALAVRAQQWTAAKSPIAEAAAQLASGAAPADPLVARLAAETAVAANDPVAAGAAFAHWAACSRRRPPSARYAAARAAELDPAPRRRAVGARRSSSIRATTTRPRSCAPRTSPPTQTQLAIDVDPRGRRRHRARPRAPARRVRLDRRRASSTPRSSCSRTAARRARARSRSPRRSPRRSPHAGRWTDRAKLLAELAAEPGEQLDRDVAQLRSALAWEEAVGAAAQAAASEGRTEHSVQQRDRGRARRRGTACSSSAGASPNAHAPRSCSRRASAIATCSARCSRARSWPSGRRGRLSSLALRRARLFAADEPQRADRTARSLRDGAAAELDDPRRTALALVIAAARRGELADAALALEERAARARATAPRPPRCACAPRSSRSTPATPRARRRCSATSSARCRASASCPTCSRPRAAAPAIGPTASARAAARRTGARRGRRRRVRAHRPRRRPRGRAGDGAAALALYQRALELRPGDPLATVPLVRVATQLREPAPLAALALAQLRAAESRRTTTPRRPRRTSCSRTSISELPRRRGSAPDRARERVAGRPDAHRSRCTASSATTRRPTSSRELIRLRRAEIEQPARRPRARIAPRCSSTLAALAERDQPPRRRARRAVSQRARGRSATTGSRCSTSSRSCAAQARRAELAGARGADRRRTSTATRAAQAAFFTRAGETLAEIGQIDAAVAAVRQGRRRAARPRARARGLARRRAQGPAVDRRRRGRDPPGHGDERRRRRSARAAPLRRRRADGQGARRRRRRDGVPARARRRSAATRDAFLRLRILLEEDGNHDDLATLLAQAARGRARRARARSSCTARSPSCTATSSSDRDTAKQHYRAILAADPQRPARARRGRRHRVGAGQLAGGRRGADGARAARARARGPEDAVLPARPDLRRSARRRADGAQGVPARADVRSPTTRTRSCGSRTSRRSAGEWKLALGACERLVKAEQDPEQARRAPAPRREDLQGRLRRRQAGRARAQPRARRRADQRRGAERSSSQFYRDAGDMASVRVHLNRVAGAMRARVDKDDPKDGVAYRVIARAMAARDARRRRRLARRSRAPPPSSPTCSAPAASPSACCSPNPRASTLAPLLRSPRPTRCCSRAACQTELRQMFRCSAIASRSTSASTCAPYGVDARRSPARASDSEVAAARAGRRDAARVRRDRRLRVDAPALRDGRRADEPGVARDRPRHIAHAATPARGAVRRRRRAQARAGVARDPGAPAGRRPRRARGRAAAPVPARVPGARPRRATRSTAQMQKLGA